MSIAKRLLRKKKWLTDLDIVRPEAGEYIGSEFIRGDDPTEFTVKAIAVPLTRLALKTTFPFEQTHVSEAGNLTEGSTVIYTLDPLQVKTEQRPGDRIIGYHDEDWEVLSSERWDEFDFYVIIASMLPRGIST